VSLDRTRAVREADRRSLLTVCALSVFILAAEVAGGVWSGSLALLADSGHVLIDLLALLLAFFAAVFASRPATTRRSYGWHRLEIISALMNGLLLVAIAVVIGLQAWSRFREPRPVNVAGMMSVAALGLVGNLLGVWILSRASSSLNLRGALLHLVGDTISSVGVIVSGVAVAVTGEWRIDAVASALIAAAIVWGAVRLGREAFDVLLEATPAGLDGEVVAAAIRRVDGVAAVHDLHIWSITTGMPALSGHVIVPAASPACGDEVLTCVQRMLRERFGIDHSTIQIESERFEEVGEVHG
jgi:cobalt-zinc-cadmium efflux system protein